jgi:hypothetical protein
MALNDTFRATIIAKMDNGTAIVFDYGYQQQSAGSEHLDTGTAAGNFQTLVQATYLAALHTTVGITRYRFACVHGDHVGEIGFVEVDPPQQGSGDGALLPQEIAISMKRSTGYSSRKDRGRVFFGPCLAAYAPGTDFDLVDTTIAELQAVRDLGKATLTTGGVTLKPVLLAGDGTTNGHVITRVAMGPVFVHHKSRRLRVGV